GNAAPVPSGSKPPAAVKDIGGAPGSAAKAQIDPPAPPTNGSATVAPNDDHRPTAGTVKHPDKANPKHPPVATADDKEDKASLIKKIQAAEAGSDWTLVRSTYQKLAKIKGMQGQALYGEALAAFQQGDSPSAEAISKKASAVNGPYKLKSLLLYADTIFRQGDVKRAKDNYVSLRALTSDREFKATVAKKIALCNKQLGLAERDGVIN
ncbi:MAG: hypothetical protein ABI678_18805, partial [Kofleriaceae bacterium]